MRSKTTQMRAKKLRRDMTAAEHKIWEIVRRRQIGGNYFRRQVPIEPYIADFACLKKRLVIEVDGSQHYLPDGVNHDVIRTKFLLEKGYEVLRFMNLEVLKNMDGVYQTIADKLHELENTSPPLLTSPANGGGIPLRNPPRHGPRRHGIKKSVVARFSRAMRLGKASGDAGSTTKSKDRITHARHAPRPLRHP